LVAFCTPPWPLHAPRPVAVDVVPSLQVVGAVESAAAAGTVMAVTSDMLMATPSSGAAIRPNRFFFIMK
jgi:hypothetical protein